MSNWDYMWFEALKKIPSIAITTPDMDGVKFTEECETGGFLRIPEKVGVILVKEGYAVQSSPFVNY